jgi:DegV family protein with EDD domain
MKKPVIISADSPCDLPQDILAQNDFRTIPLYVNLMGRSLRDGIDISPAEIFSAYDQHKVIPTTSAVPVGDYQEHFETLLAGGSNEVVHFCIGGTISSSYQNAVTAVREFEGVHLVDSESMSVGIALQLLHAAKLREEGESAEAIAREAQHYRKRVRTTALLGSPTYMKRSGRCSAVSALGANLLNIRPMLGMIDGKLSALKKLRGKPASVQQQYIQELLAAPEQIEPSIAFLYHTGITPEEFINAKAAVENTGIFQEVRTGHAGSVTCTHVGDHCVIFMYAMKADDERQASGSVDTGSPDA